MTEALRQETSKAADLAAARRVLQLESAGLQALSHQIDQRFCHALDVIAATRDRVIVTGMGKSGHVGRKLAATLASTGTPAMFVHPSEASHGDLGMITPNDSLVALSNSGETPELADILSYAKRFAIPLIAITGVADSELARSADVVLIVPKTPEACPMGLAPTTSTTVMLALGDCLAVAMLERRGFSSADFRLLHPGGRLGRRLLHVADIMHVGPALPLASPAAPMAEVLIVMSSKGFGCVGIVDNDRHLLGVITDGDLRRHMAPNITDLEAATVMTLTPKTTRPDALASEALGVMNSRAITQLFVIETNRVVGLLHIHDCLRAGVA